MVTKARKRSSHCSERGFRHTSHRILRTERELLIRDHLYACHMYLAPRQILIRPLIPPTRTHIPFAGARQRLYMSATLGEAGELERLTGTNKLVRLPVPT